MSRAAGSYDVAHRERMLRIAARLVDAHGEAALPLFERCEAELEVARGKSSALARAREIAQSAA